MCQSLLKGVGCWGALAAAESGGFRRLHRTPRLRIGKVFGESLKKLFCVRDEDKNQGREPNAYKLCRWLSPRLQGTQRTQGTVESHLPVKPENPKTLESQEGTKADYTRASLGQQSGMRSLICGALVLMPMYAVHLLTSFHCLAFDFTSHLCTEKNLEEMTLYCLPRVHIPMMSTHLVHENGAFVSSVSSAESQQELWI